jgi:hypothetical protein
MTILFWMLVVACAVAQFYIVRGLFRAEVSPAEQSALGAAASSVPQPRRAAEVAWAILPLVGLVAVFVGAWRLMSV